MADPYGIRRQRKVLPGVSEVIWWVYLARTDGNPATPFLPPKNHFLGGKRDPSTLLRAALCCPLCFFEFGLFLRAGAELARAVGIDVHVNNLFLELAELPVIAESLNQVHGRIHESQP